MFVVVAALALCCWWIETQRRLVHERLAFLESEESFWAEDTNNPNLNPHIPFWRHWMGDRPVIALDIPSDTTDIDLERLRRLFQEARVERMSSDQ